MQDGAQVPLRPRERIISTARDLFRKHGIRGIGVDAIAEAAGTNKMTLYRHFGSKDELIAECLRDQAGRAEAKWAELDAGATEPEALADGLHLLLEGARVSRQSVGPDGPCARFVKAADAIIASMTT